MLNDHLIVKTFQRMGLVFKSTITWQYPSGVSVISFQPGVPFHKETSHFDLQCKSNDWFLCEMQHLAEIDLSNLNRKQFMLLIYKSSTQLTYTCLKSTIETLEKGVKYVSDVVLVILLLTLKIFHAFFQCFYCLI